MVPSWLNVLSIVSLSVAAICSAIVLIDLVRHPQEMTIMNWVWPITALYGGPLALWMYARLGWPASREAIKRNEGRMAEKPFYSSVAVSATHCGAGCVLGDVIAEFAIFFTGFTILGLDSRSRVRGRLRTSVCVRHCIPVLRDRADASSLASTRAAGSRKSRHVFAYRI